MSNCQGKLAFSSTKTATFLQQDAEMRLPSCTAMCYSPTTPPHRLVEHSHTRTPHPHQLPPTMSNIAERVLSKPRSCKKPPPSTSVFAREHHKYKLASRASIFHWTDINIIEAANPTNEAIREFQQFKREFFCTPEVIHRRDALIRRFLPSLRAAGLVPRCSSNYVEKLVRFFGYQDEETRNFWQDYCHPLVLNVDRANAQMAFIARKDAERAAIQATAAIQAAAIQAEEDRNR